jgi:hypothetical protein
MELLTSLEQSLKHCTNCEVGVNIMDRVLKRVVNAPKYEDDASVKYRASKVGRPWVLQKLDRWYGGKQKYTVGSTMAMLNGNIAQEWVAELLTTFGYEFSQEVSVSYRGVGGHIDFLVFDHGTRTVAVLEVKSMATHLVTPFKNAPHDDYGYVSQLSVYVKAVRKRYPDYSVEQAFVVFDRSMSKLHVVPIRDHAVDDRIARIDYGLTRLETVADYDVDALLAAVILPPVNMNGTVPLAMARSRWADVFYKVQPDGKYKLADVADIAMQLKQLPLQRADLAPLT